MGTKSRHKTPIVHGSAASGPPETPILRIETGMHIAGIRRIAVTPDEGTLATASSDKTVRLWDLKSGSLKKILRIPMGKGYEGRLYAVAISPDGKTLATGGWTGDDWDDSYSIYLFRMETGVLFKRITGIPNVIFHLAFSKNGRWLAAAIGGPNGISIYDTETWSLKANDQDYGDSSFWLEFDHSGRLVTTSDDGYIRLYDSRFRMIQKNRVPSVKKPFSASFSPDGQKIAVGGYDFPGVDILSGKDLSHLFSPDCSGTNRSLSSVTWSLDGNTLYAGGKYNNRTGFPIRKWTRGGRGSHRDLPASDNTIMQLIPLGGGRLIFGSYDPAFGVIDAEGERTLLKTASNPDYRGLLDDFRVSKDGGTVRFGFKEWGKASALFSIASRTLELILPQDNKGATLVAPVTKSDTLRITGWRNSCSPELNETPIPLNAYEMSRSLAISPDKGGFLLGTDWYLRCYDSSGTLRWKAPLQGVGWSVNISGDGIKAMVACHDGTIQWYGMSDGKKLVSLFPEKGGKRWVLWTPEGFFDADGGGEALIGYHLNQGPATAGKFVNIEQLYNLFYRPDLVAKSFQGGFEADIREELAQIGGIEDILTGGSPPRVTIHSKNGARLTQRDFTLEFSLEDMGGGVGRIEYRVNGILISSTDSSRSQGLLPGRRSGKIKKNRRPFTLNNGNNTITVTAYDKYGNIASIPVEITVHVDDPRKEPPSLFVLAIGISAYRDSELKLNFAGSDARDLSHTLESGGKGLFKEIHTTLLVDSQAGKYAISKAFERLSKTVKTSDLFVLYLAGHGEARYGNYYFVPWDAVFENLDSFLEASLSSKEILSLLEKISARKSLILLDTCKSGKFFAAMDSGILLSGIRGLPEKTAIDRLMRASGRTFIVSSSEKQPAMEGYKNHGVFTHALIQGLQGGADRQGKGEGLISVDELADYVWETVPEITKEKWGVEQIPMRRIYGDPFALVRFAR
jgi:WD40 repeat protein